LIDLSSGKVSSNPKITEDERKKSIGIKALYGII
jgi:hypothetical protein